MFNQAFDSIPFRGSYPPGTADKAIMVRFEAAFMLYFIILQVQMPPASLQNQFEDFKDVEGNRACVRAALAQDGPQGLARCNPDADLLLELVADHVSAQAGGSIPETWLRMGTKLFDMVSQPGPVCEWSSAGSGGWRRAVLHARRAMVVGLRLMSDDGASPKLGTHAALSLGRMLLHPCLSAHAAQRSSAASRYSSSHNVGAGEGSAQLVSRSMVALDEGHCEEAVDLAHKAARADPDSVSAWYSVQVCPRSRDLPPPGDEV